MKIIRRKALIKPMKRTDKIFKETEKLIAIVAKGIETATNNKKGGSQKLTLNIDGRKLNI